MLYLCSRTLLAIGSGVLGGELVEASRASWDAWLHAFKHTREMRLDGYGGGSYGSGYGGGYGAGGYGYGGGGATPPSSLPADRAV